MEQKGRREVIDPICGMAVDPEKTDLKSERDGKTFYFCAPHCRDEFDRMELGSETGLAKDAICGMDVDIGETEYSLCCNGQMFYFCSEGCLRIFQKKLSRKKPKTAFGRWLARLADQNEAEFGFGGPCCH